MRRTFMIASILLITLISSACDGNKTNPTETAVPSATVIITATSTTQPTETTAATSTEVPVTETPTTIALVNLPACPPETLPVADWPFYCDESNGFFFQYPADATLGEHDAGAIHIDLSVVPGTNLGEKYVDITTKESSKTCTSPIASDYVPDAITTEELTINGLDFLKQSGKDAGAGNYYDWIAYSTGMNGKCVSFGFVLHSTNRYNYPTPPPEFDFDTETAVFEQMVNTFRWVSP